MILFITLSILARLMLASKTYVGISVSVVYACNMCVCVCAHALGFLPRKQMVVLTVAWLAGCTSYVGTTYVRTCLALLMPLI